MEVNKKIFVIDCFEPNNKYMIPMEILYIKTENTKESYDIFRSEQYHMINFENL